MAAANSTVQDVALSFPPLPYGPPLPRYKLAEMEALQKHRRDPASSQLTSIVFEKDLVMEAFRLLALLYEVDAASDLALYSGRGMRLAIYRYETMWLPLLAKHPEEVDLAAPLDAAWVWLMHSLAPSKYAADLRDITGCTAGAIKANSPQSRDPGAVANGKRLWIMEYGEESYQSPGVRKLEHASSGYDWSAAKQHVSRSQYDLTEAAARQQVFLYQVSLPHWRQRWFLERCLERYKQFLHLRREEPRAFLVPTFDIDLLWHSHMACHGSYVRDMQRATGSFFDHDDSINDRTPAGRLDNGYRGTTELWQTVFGQEYLFEGGMYRGKKPDESIQELCRQKGWPSEEMLSRAQPQATQRLNRELRATVHTEAQGSLLRQYTVLSASGACGQVVARVPFAVTSPPTCIVALDAQGRVAAVSRVIGRDQLPLRSQRQRDCHVPCHDVEPHNGPAFLIQSCGGSGGGQDWAIVRGNLDPEGRVFPEIYRLGTEFYDSSAGPFWQQAYLGKMAADITLAGEGKSVGATVKLAYHKKLQHLKSSRSVPEPPDRSGCCFCMHASRAAAGNTMAVLKLPAKGHMCITVGEGENEACLMALAATLHVLFSALTGQDILPSAAR